MISFSSPAFATLFGKCLLGFLHPNCLTFRIGGTAIHNDDVLLIKRKSFRLGQVGFSFSNGDFDVELIEVVSYCAGCKVTIVVALSYLRQVLARLILIVVYGGFFRM